MNIYTVADNLRITIAGKERYLVEVRTARCIADRMEDIALHAVQKLLEINIDELKKILADVEVCCNQYSEMGWALNPERMGQ